MAEVIAQLEKQLELERKELAYARLKIQVLEERLRQQRIAQYGPGSETLSNLQLGLLEEEPAVSRDEVQAESEREPVAPPPATSGKKQREPHPGRQTSGAFAARGKGGRVCALAVCLHLLRRPDNGIRQSKPTVDKCGCLAAQVTGVSSAMRWSGVFASPGSMSAR